MYLLPACDGDPLGLGDRRELTDDEAYEVALETDYPDSLVQISRLSDSPRSGEIILSAARGWDFRAKYEPIPTHRRTARFTVIICWFRFS